MEVIMMLGILFALLNFEVILLFILELPIVQRFNKKLKNKIRHFFWQCFDFKNDFVEK